jgi:tetratricopeptide (TPR) repeat protein
VDRPRSLRTILAASSLAGLMASSAHAAEPAAIGQAAVERMIDLNRKAYADIQNQRFQAAKYWLAEALVISETAGLENDEMTARTYVHLAVVYLTGLGNREQAIKQFSLALKINPNITISAGLETPALKSAYLQAREEMDLPPNPDATAELAAPAATPRASSSATPESPEPVPLDTSHTGSLLDPDLPARVSTPLFCSLPFEVPAGQDLIVRCLTQKQQKRASATLYYRLEANSTSYAALPMAHSPKGWLLAIIPGSDVQGKSLSYYVKAQLPSTSHALHYGYPEAPKALLIRAVRPGDGQVGAGTPEAGRASVEGRDGSHRRAPGAFWLALGAGIGTVYHGREPVDSNTRMLGTGNPLYVESGFSAATIFQLEPEIGYQLSERFSVSALLRYQYAPMSGSFKPQQGQHQILTSAFAGFLRTQLLFGREGSFQPYLSGGAGLGRSFLAVVARRCDTNLCALDHSDTLHGGFWGLTAGLGLLYRFSPSFGLFVDVKEIMTLPKVMALSEVNLGAEFAFASPKASSRAETDDLVAWE